jgi:catechol 2,3-dioxygenase-like lactoylglutathione lyase family enzyme
MPIKSVAHVCLKATDLAKASDFYCGALGMKKVFNFTRRGEVIGFYLKASNETFIEVFTAEEVDALGRQCLNHFCLETENIEDLRRDLAVRGYSPGEVKMGADRSFQFWMNDPSGLAIEFQQYTDQSSQRTGQPVEANW